LKVQKPAPRPRAASLVRGRSRSPDSGDFTIFLQEVPSPVEPNGCALWFQVADVDATFAEWVGRGIKFAHGPRKSYWGYGAELEDPDGCLVRLWDERSMKEN